MGVLLSLALAGQNAPAQSSPPPLPTLPTGKLLDVWEFQDTNWLSVFRDAPLSFTNLSLTEDWAGTGLLLDSPDPAFLNYSVLANDGSTNIAFVNGSLSFWFSPDWSTSDSIGNWGTLLETGAWSTNAATGAWGLYLSPDASAIYFSAQTNNFSTNYLNAPIDWNAGEWHQIVLTYSPTNTALYLEGALVATGDGITLDPGFTNSFSIGSDGTATGTNQARGTFNRLFTYDYQLDPDTIADTYALDSQSVYPLPWNGHSHTDVVPPPPPGGGTNGGSTNLPPYLPPYTSQYGSNQFWIEALKWGTNIYNHNSNSLTLKFHGTIPDIAYQLLSTTNLQPTNTVWTVEQNLLGSEVTNFTVTSVLLTGRPAVWFKVLAFTLDSDGDGLPDWWELKYSVTGHLLSYTNADTGNTGIADGYKLDAAGDGYNNLQKYQMGIAPGTWATPPAPTGLTVSTNGTHATLTWNASAGPVTHYIILRQDPGGSFHPIATNGPTSMSYVDSGAFTVGDPLSEYDPGSTYEIEAVYAGGNSQATLSQMLGDFSSPGYAVNAKLVRGPFGRWQLVFSAIPSGVHSIKISYGEWDYWSDINFDSGISQTIAITNLVNSRYLIPDSAITNYVGANQWIQYEGADTGLDDSWGNYGAYDYGFLVFVQGVGTNGVAGPYVRAGNITQDAPYFMDGRQQLQLGLNFLIQGAGSSQPFTLANSFPYQYFFSTISTNFIEHSFIHPAITDKGYEGGTNTFKLTPYVAMDNTWPFVVDFLLANWLYSTNPVPDFAWQPDFNSSPFAPQLEPNGTYQSGPYWIFQGSANLAQYGARTTNSGNTVSLTNGIHNLFGLLQTNALAVGSGVDTSHGYVGLDPITGFPVYPPETHQLSPGGSISFTNGPLASYASQFPAPALKTTNYYFAPVNSPGMDVIGLTTPIQNYPLPLNSSFAVTNVTPLMIGAVGTSMVIGGWAKQAITNGTAGKFAYLGQYFQTNAYKVNTNGALTTNTTGIISPYGEFFPTEPGPTALITMPDLTTGQTGTSVVQVIKLQLDVNHDGTMDTTFTGPDNTSAGQPFRFWVNNDCDIAAVGGSPDQDVNSPKTPDLQYGNIQSQRDLEDYARLWICGVPALTNSGYIVTLRWTNVISGNPSIKLFNSAETDGGIAYLTNATTAAAQISVSGSAPGSSIGTVTNGTTFTFPTSYFTGGTNKFFLFEGAGIGQGELDLTISKNGINIATFPAFIDLHDVIDFYERANITNVSQAWPDMVQANLTSGFQVVSYATASSGESNQMAVFVHGWRMTQWDYDNFLKPCSNVFTGRDTKDSLHLYAGQRGQLTLNYLRRVLTSVTTAANT